MTKDDLYELYHIEKKSSIEIGKIFGINPRTVRYLRQKYGIPAKNRKNYLSRRKNTSLTNKEKEIIIGETLGDAYLRKQRSSSHASFEHHSSKKDYLVYLRESLKNLTFRRPIREESRQVVENIKQYYYLTSCTHPDLTDIHNLIYDECKNKHIPPDLVITPTILLHWYIGDGESCINTIHRHYKTYRIYRYRVIGLSVCAFQKIEIIYFQQQLAKLGIHFTLHRGERKYRLYLKRSSYQTFFDYIGHESPVDSYRYKFDGA